MLWRGIGAFAAVAILGAVAGHVATGDGEPPATRTIHVGAAIVTVPAAWRVVNGPGTTLSNGHDRMRVAFGTPADRSLVPPALRGETRSGAPKPARLAGYRAWSYGGVTVLPSARGVLGVACTTAECVRAVRSVAITGAAILTPAPDLALRLRAPSLLATLDAARADERALLAATSDAGANSEAAPGGAPAAAAPVADANIAATSAADANPSATPAADADSTASPGADPAAAAAAVADASSTAAPGADPAAAATPVADADFAAPSAATPLRRLAAAHHAALDGLRPVAGPALIGALSQAEQAYLRLADVSSAADYDTARAAVVSADRDVDLAVTSLARVGAPAGQRPPVPPKTPHGGVSALMLLLVLATGLLVSALAPAGVRRLRTSVGGEPCAVVKPCLVAQGRRTPIAPPPTYGRWNEAPRGPSAGVAVENDDARDGVMASSSTT
jgi:hypothetical protein